MKQGVGKWEMWPGCKTRLGGHRGWPFLSAGWMVLLLLIVLTVSSNAQVQVDVALKRSLYMVYEPLICNVTITNLSGGTLILEDTPREKWFGFQIETIDGRPLPPVNPDYRNQPVEIEPGQRLSRSINLTPLYPLSEFGTYRVKAAVYSAQMGKYFTSPQLNIEITEGRQLWQQTVGVPDGLGAGRTRTFTILAHRLPRTTMLYLRVEDKEAGVIYCTTQLGRFITFASPDIEIDSGNQIHILQNTAPKAFLYSHFDVNGKVIKQQAYQSFDSKPYLVRKPDASVAVVGGVAYDPKAPPPERQLPKLSDRPVPLPTPQLKAKPQDKRPENLLSR
ncbi:MAG TPA: hypothetical protein VIT18_09700 [Terrimicrobiaceae bacterium]